MASLQTAFDFGATRPVPWLTATQSLDSERLRTTLALERQLARLLGGQVRLTFTDNSRTMLSARKRAETTHVRLHQMFEAADESTIASVARYLQTGHGGASGHLSHFIETHRHHIRRVEQAHPLRLGGRHHDLEALLRLLNARYFDNAVTASIGWAKRARARTGARRRRSIKLGSYLARGALIRVHPALDAAWVPSFFVEYIVYHEMLHHVIAMPTRKGRRRLHGPEFRARERLFERFAEAHLWERAHLDRLLCA